MTLELQFKIKSNPLYIKYLHLNSYWYKILTRNPLEFNKFEEEVKEYYHLRTTDKIKKAFDTMELIGSIISSFK